MAKKRVGTFVQCGYCKGGEVFVFLNKHAVRPENPKCQDCLLNENLDRAEAQVAALRAAKKAKAEALQRKKLKDWAKGKRPPRGHKKRKRPA